MTKTFKQGVNDALFVVSIIISIALHLIDIGSDIFLAHRYYANEDYWWCGLTITFVASPWIYIIFFIKTHDGIGITFIAAVFNLLPVNYCKRTVNHSSHAPDNVLDDSSYLIKDIHFRLCTSVL